ncbi:MAG TPA: phytanoyl-CoA dioxygenase family protein [Candidatus Dormibacteraeota bacterium]|jgi:ectoine hydroxylase-related dioxygenase (phytanoyl-CoA dioxygenase family)|nr:phytanoyl-CoA dioxygenase family protein [Candidatus Dormibacteraeota bacterium]
MLTSEQVASYREHGYLRVPQVFTPEETEGLGRSLDWIIDTWASRTSGWTGPWRQKYMTEEVEKKSKLVSLHDLQFYSVEWMRAVTNPRLAAVLADLLGPNIELHHSTLHVKPPETGHPFPMHQDDPFYPHTDGRYVDVLVHLDDTSAANGEIRFLDGSHLGGRLEHITETADGPCSPHLPTDQYRLEDTVPVPAKAGDVVCFSIHTVHGSYLNTTDRNRRMVRVGFRDPENEQLGGQSHGRPGLIVAGERPRAAEQAVLTERAVG